MRIRPLFFLVLVFFVACSGLNSNLNNNDVGGDKGGVIDPSLSGSGITAPSAEDIAASQPITGQIRVTMHDAPIEDKKVSHVYITIREVQIGSEEKGWIVLNSTPQEYDLLTLVNDVTAALGGATIAAGTYDQIRLILSEENRVIAEGIEQKLKTPSGQQTGIKLDGPFTVGSGEIVSVELDFDAQESIHWNSGQGFMLKPVIKILSVVSADGLFGARQISADTGGVVALPDGAMIQIPPGALPANTDITMEKVPDSAGGSLVGDVYFLGPDGLKLNAPVIVRLPYDPSKIPADSTEADLVLTSNFERIKGTEINTDEHVVVAPVSHFSPHWPETWKEHPVPLGPTNGILHYPHYTDWTSYNVFLIDLNESSQKLKVLLAPDSGKGDGSRYLRTVKEMVESAETQLIGGNSIPLAINGWTWDGEEGRQIVCDATDCLGWLNSSTYVDGEEKLFCVSDATGLNLGPVDSQCLSEKKDEVEEKLIFSNSGPTEAAIGQWNNKNDLPHKWGVMGSTILVTSNGEFAPTDEYLADRPRLTEYNARTAVGINKARSKLIFFVGGRDVLDDGPPSRGINIRSVHNKLKEFGADRVLLLDGGYSTSLLLNGEEQYSVLGLARNVISGLAVVQSPIITPPGPQPVAVEDPVQGQITVGQCDMGDPFCLLGPSDFWFSKEGLGSGGHMWWTYANETPNAVNKNQAKWIPNILASGVYRVEAFIPSNCATTTCARYKIAHNGQTHCKVINQYNISTDVTGEYAYLGKFRFQAGTGGNVALDDVTYEKWITVTSPARQVGVDLIRFVPVDGNAEEAEACDDSKFQVDCSKVVSKSTPCRP